MNDRSNEFVPDAVPHAPARLAARIAEAGLDWIVPQWPAPPAVGAFVTTRNGTASVEAFLPRVPFWLQQVHGADVVDVDASQAVGAPPGHATTRSANDPPRADAAVTRGTNVVLAVRFADCLPVLFADSAGAVIGIAHAGWRGLAASVLERTVSAMRCEPAQIVAWLGPAIGKSAFEVGTDVYDAFVADDADAATAFAPGAPGKWHADLEALARMRLRRAGIASIHGGGMCTVSDPARFFSFRRDRATGRMAAFLWREGSRR